MPNLKSLTLLKFKEKPASHIYSQSEVYSVIYTTIQKFEVSNIFLFFLNTFIQQGHIHLIKSDSKDLHCYADILFQTKLLQNCFQH